VNKPGTPYSRDHKRRRREAQAGRPRPDKCEVCHAPPKGRQLVLSWDHNHETSTFRGWLCTNCNNALGHAGDNPTLLRALADYLVANGAAPTRPVIR
jgi:hypothetical protein